MEPQERVSVIDPIDPEQIIILAPHLEQYTDLIAEEMAKKLGCYAVINRGWERDEKVDFMNDKANCNSIAHLYHDVVREEFLDPIFNFASKIRRAQFVNIYIFIIHGFVCPIKDGPEIVLGFGSGAKRLSCNRWRKNAFAYHLQTEGFNVHAGKAGGKFAGSGKDNLNQLFKRENPIENSNNGLPFTWGIDDSIHSLQLEIDMCWRESEQDATFAAEAISRAVESLVELGDEGFEKDIKLPEY